MEYYSKFFNLQLNPFGETPDPDFFYDSATHNRALNALNLCVRQGRGFALLTGEVGMGKTLTSRIFLTSLQKTCNTALVLFPRFSETELLQTICEEFEVPGLTDEKRTAKGYLDLLNSFLIKSAEAGRKSILLIDEAQSMPTEALEAIRLISNLETRTQKLLHIILVAQPEVREKLDRPEIRQLRQRISVDLSLTPLDQLETERYIKNRLETAGSGNFIRFDVSAISVVHQLSGGIPRKINQICETLITEAQVKKIRLLDARFVRAILGLSAPSLFEKIFSSSSRSVG